MLLLVLWRSTRSLVCCSPLQDGFFIDLKSPRGLPDEEPRFARIKVTMCVAPTGQLCLTKAMKGAEDAADMEGSPVTSEEGQVWHVYKHVPGIHVGSSQQPSGM